MPKCPTCHTTMFHGQKKCHRCAVEPPQAAAPAAAAHMPADWKSVKYSIKESPGIRRAFAAALDIEDKGHAQHGSNFTSSQTKKEILDNLLSPCRKWPATKWNELKQRCIATYGYDPEA